MLCLCCFWYFSHRNICIFGSTWIHLQTKVSPNSSWNAFIYNLMSGAICKQSKPKINLNEGVWVFFVWSQKEQSFSIAIVRVFSGRHPGLWFLSAAYPQCSMHTLMHKTQVYQKNFWKRLWGRMWDICDKTKRHFLTLFLLFAVVHNALVNLSIFPVLMALKELSAVQLSHCCLIHPLAILH